MRLSPQVVDKASWRVEEPEPTRRTVEIQIPSAEVQRLRHVFLKAMSKGFTLPGFRKGRVPTELVARRLGEEAEQSFREEVVEAFAQEYARRERFPLTRGIRLTSWEEEGGACRVSWDMEVVPPFTLPPYRGLQATVTRHQVTDEEVEAFLTSLRTRLSSLVPKQDPIQEGDLVTVSLQRITSTGLPLVGEGTKEATVVLREGETPPELVRALTGLRPGDSTRLRLSPSPKGVIEPAPSAQEPETYLCTVTKAFTVHPPDPQTVARHLHLEDPEELPVRVRVMLQERRDREAREALREELLARVAKAAVIHLPQSLVDERVEEARQSLLEEAQAQGGHVDPSLQDPMFFAEMYRETVRQNLKELLVVEVIAQEAGLHATEQQVEAALAAHAAMARSTPSQVRRQLGREGIERIARRITRQNVLRFLEEEAEVEFEDAR